MQPTFFVEHPRAGVDNVWEQEKLEATLREMLDEYLTNFYQYSGLLNAFTQDE